MVAFATMMIALLAQQHARPEPTAIYDETFHVSGSTCASYGCSSLSEFMSSRLRFASNVEGARFKSAKRLGHSWNVQLDCRIVGDTIKFCQSAKDPRASAPATRVALKMVSGLRLLVAEDRERHAVVSVTYDTSDCPFWRCTPVLDASPLLPGKTS